MKPSDLLTEFGFDPPLQTPGVMAQWRWRDPETATLLCILAESKGPWIAKTWYSMKDLDMMFKVNLDPVTLTAPDIQLLKDFALLNPEDPEVASVLKSCDRGDGEARINGIEQLRKYIFQRLHGRLNNDKVSDESVLPAIKAFLAEQL